MRYFITLLLLLISFPSFADYGSHSGYYGNNVGSGSSISSSTVLTGYYVTNQVAYTNNSQIWEGGASASQGGALTVPYTYAFTTNDNGISVPVYLNGAGFCWFIERSVPYGWANSKFPIDLSGFTTLTNYSVTASTNFSVAGLAPPYFAVNGDTAPTSVVFGTNFASVVTFVQTNLLLPTGNIDYVDTIRGSDIYGQRTNQDSPFLTLHGLIAGGLQQGDSIDIIGPLDNETGYNDFLTNNYLFSESGTLIYRTDNGYISPYGTNFFMNGLGVFSSSATTAPFLIPTNFGINNPNSSLITILNSTIYGTYGPLQTAYAPDNTNKVMLKLTGSDVSGLTYNVEIVGPNYQAELYNDYIHPHGGGITPGVGVYAQDSDKIDIVGTVIRPDYGVQTNSPTSPFVAVDSGMQYGQGIDTPAAGINIAGSVIDLNGIPTNAWQLAGTNVNDDSIYPLQTTNWQGYSYLGGTPILTLTNATYENACILTNNYDGSMDIYISRNSTTMVAFTVLFTITLSHATSVNPVSAGITGAEDVGGFTNNWTAAGAPMTDLKLICTSNTISGVSMNTSLTASVTYCLRITCTRR